jgi:hypothetical protein
MISLLAATMVSCSGGTPPETTAPKATEAATSVQPPVVASDVTDATAESDGSVALTKQGDVGAGIPTDNPDRLLDYDPFVAPDKVTESTGACSFPKELFPAKGQPVEMITWVRGDKVMGLGNGTSEAVCLYQSKEPITTLQWSPVGDRLLVGSTTVVTPDGAVPSGFAAGDDVRWSLAMGKSLLGRLADGTLRKHTFDPVSSKYTADRSVSFLDDHETVIYHPAGKHIFAIGTGAEPGGNAKQVGVWFADNLGLKRKIAIRDIDALDISEPAFDGTGSSFFFIAKHKTHNHVHLYSTSTSKFSVAIDRPEPISNLVVQQAYGSTAAVQVGSCRGTKPTTIASSSLIDNKQMSFTFTDSEIHPEFADRWLMPVALPMGRQMLFLSRPNGCIGPATLHLEYEDENDDAHRTLTKKIVDNVEIVALRGVQSLPRELGAIVSAQVVT